MYYNTTGVGKIFFEYPCGNEYQQSRIQNSKLTININMHINIEKVDGPGAAPPGTGSL